MSESPRGPSPEGPAIGEVRASPAGPLRALAREALAQAREGAQAKEAELWARYRALTKERRARRQERA